MSPPGSGAAVAALEELIRRCQAAGPGLAFGGSLLVEKFAKLHASGPHGPHTLGVITGRLRASIRARPPTVIRPNTWQSKCYPTVVYARIQELGGHIYPKPRIVFGKKTWWNTTGIYPHVLRWFDDEGRPVFAHHVYLPPRPYLRPGRDDAVKPYWELVYKGIGDALGVD